jgi:hypothetical protein
MFSLSLFSFSAKRKREMNQSEYYNYIANNKIDKKRKKTSSSSRSLHNPTGNIN